MPNICENMDSTSPTEFNKLWRGKTLTSLKFAVDWEIKTAPFEERASCRWHASSERKILYRRLLFCAFQPHHYNKLQAYLTLVRACFYKGKISIKSSSLLSVILLYEIPLRTRIRAEEENEIA